MLHTPMARRGMISTPHHLASQAGLAVLREGGNAIEAAIAAAAALAVVYPHMNGLGGDGFWLIAEPGKPPVSIDGSGAAGAHVDLELYRAARLRQIPEKGPLAATTVAGLVSGWRAALDVSAQWGGGIPLERLFDDAMTLARDGYAITAHQAQATQRHLTALRRAPGFGELFLLRNKVPAAGSWQSNPALAATFEHLARVGLDDFYRGDVARTISDDLKQASSPLIADDLARHRGMRRRPLSLATPSGMLFNTAPPTQGLAALILLGVFQRLKVANAGGFDWVHGLAEATKAAYRVRDAHIADPQRMSVHATTYLTDPLLDAMAEDIDFARAAPWGRRPDEGDTVWLGVIDGQGRAVSCIQSLYHAFGSGVTLPRSGVVWHNRGHAFSLDPLDRNVLEPRRKPRHTLSPALARLKDGRTVVWGSMGGDLQPQIQAQLYTRAIAYGQGPQAAISAPRFALANAGAGQPGGLLLEDRWPAEVVEALTRAGHHVSLTGPFDPALGQAGMLIRRADATIEGGCDPRSDGSVAAW